MLRVGVSKCLVEPEDAAPLFHITSSDGHTATVAAQQAHINMVQQVTPIIERAMNGPIQIFSPTPYDQTRFQFQVQTTAPCQLCGVFHGVSLYSCSCVLAPCCSVRNQDSRCKEHVLGWKEVEVFQSIIANPKGDAPFAELFRLQQASRGLVWRHDGKDFYMHDGILWRPQTDVAFRKSLQDVVRPILKELTKFVYNTAVDKDQKNKETDKQTKGLWHAYRELEKARQVDSVMRESKVAMHDVTFSQRIDSDSHQLGMENGIVALDTCTFRPSTAADMVSMSVGYSWLEPDQWDPMVESELYSFLELVYPLPEERTLFQKFAGYCLLGRHPAKVLGLLTVRALYIPSSIIRSICTLKMSGVLSALQDCRGGNNGKSTVLSLLRAAMGEYATKTDATILYRSDHVRSVNDHSSGLLAFQKIRLIQIEETDSTKVLNSE